MKKIFLLSFAALLLAGGCNKNNEKVETPPHAASTQTWTFADQIWSDAIQMPACNKYGFINSRESPDCRCYTYGEQIWYYYNWSFVSAYQADMCPAPWRVPTRDDMRILDSNTTGEQLNAAWSLPGYAIGKSIYYVGEHAYYWASSYYNESRADYLYYIAGDYVVGSTYKEDGYSVRCVR